MDKLSGIGGLGSLDGLGNKSTDLDLPTLIELAKSQGGSVGEIAEELTHHNRSILSTVGQGFKNAFRGFIDVISMPSEIIAGAIDPNITISEAIKQNKRVSDVIFGDDKIDFNKDNRISTMEKIGNFFVRLPVDILTDPLTYVTFGASSTKGFLGVLGLKSLPKVSLGQRAAATLGREVEVGETIARSLSDKGFDTLSYIKKLEAQANGTLSAQQRKSLGLEAKSMKEDLIKSGVEKEVLDLSEQELKHLMNNTLDSQLNPEFAKKTMSMLFENNPALVKEFIDKGGIKFFGKSMLSAQRIRGVSSMIPGVKQLDYLTKPLRDSVSSLFDPAMVKTDDGFIRLPEEYVSLRQQFKDIGESLRSDSLTTLERINKVFNPSLDELKSVEAALLARKMPADPRLAQMYREFLGIQDNQLSLLRKAGVPISKLDNYVGLVYVPTDTRQIAKFNSKFASEVGTQKMAQYSKLIKQSDKTFKEALPELSDRVDQLISKGATDVVSESKINDIIQSSRSAQEVTTAIGKYKDQLIDAMVKTGKSIDDALNDEGIKNLDELVKQIDASDFKQTEKVGRLDKLDVEETDELGIFKNSEDEVFKRVATSANELKAAGIDGFDDNLLTAYTKMSMQNITQGIGQWFMSDLARNFGRWSDEVSEKWRPISSSGIESKAKNLPGGLYNMKTGNELVFHPGIATDFEAMMKTLSEDGATTGFLKFYDKLNRLFKASVTSIFPQFHGRNAISNVFQNFLDLGASVLDPRKHFTAIDIMAKNSKFLSLQNKVTKGVAGASSELSDLLSKEIFTDKQGTKWTFGELRRVIKDNNIAFNRTTTGAIDLYDRDSLTKFYGIDMTKGSKAKKIAGKVNPLDPDTFFPTKVGRKLGTVIEEQARLVNFTTNLINTGDVVHAANRTKQFLFDYGNLTPFEKNVLRRIVPFYTFSRKNLELQFKTLMSTPGLIATEVKGVTAIGDLIDAETLTPEEQALLPKWLKNGLNLKKETVNGKTELLTNFGLPLEQPFQQFQKNQLLGSISPFIRYPLESASGYSFFRGKAISDIIDADKYAYAPKALKDFIGYTEYSGKYKDGTEYTRRVALKPEKMFLIDSLPYTGRTMNVFGQITDKDIGQNEKLLQQLTGIRTQTIDFKLAEEQKAKELQDAVERLLINSGELREFKKTYKPKK